MKMTYVLIPALAVFFAASLPAAAADEPAADAKAEKPMVKKKTLKPHSHLEEKTGVSAAPAEAKPGDMDAEAKKKLHYHPRDAK